MLYPIIIINVIVLLRKLLKFSLSFIIFLYC